LLACDKDEIPLGQAAQHSVKKLADLKVTRKLLTAFSPNKDAS
jgi:hypothetical protein